LTPIAAASFCAIDPALVNKMSNAIFMSEAHLDNAKNMFVK